MEFTTTFPFSTRFTKGRGRKKLVEKLNILRFYKIFKTVNDG
jgi:hypothetical protein